MYDVLHTWPYEADHRFYPAIRSDGPHDAVTARHWDELARDLGLPLKVSRRIVDRVTSGVMELLEKAGDEIQLSEAWIHDLRRRIERRIRYLRGQ